MKNMIISIVEKGRGNALMERLRSSGAPGGTLVGGKGTASRTFLSLFGLGEAKKDILFSFVDGEHADGCWKEAKSFRTKGCAFISREEGGEDDMWRMITVVAEKGYAEDIMATARKAGARGGTVLSAHGTATEDDVKFFGSSIVPEKEMLMIVASRETADAVASAVKAMPCLEEKGMGILFSVPVTDFTTFGE